MYAQDYPTGLEFDDDNYAKQPLVSMQQGGKSLPSSMDLSIYTPIPRHQGTIFSCVGWSVGYGALTMERAIRNGWTDKYMITNESSSALYLYNQIKIGDCNRGARISDALVFLQQQGDCLAKYYDKNLDDCEQPVTASLQRNAADYRISDYAALFENEGEGLDKTSKVKQALAQKKPVVVGMRIRNNFTKLEDAAFWHPDLGDTTYAGGHAMVVVGYDDQVGAFRLFNSWGPKWGKNGLIWVKYGEFAKFCKYGYILYVGGNSPIVSAPVPSAARTSPVVSASNQPVSDPLPEAAPLREIAGKFDFMRFTGQFNTYGEPRFEEATVSGQKNIYDLIGQTWQTGDRFQLQVTPEFANGYLYVLSLDPVDKVEVHWPKNEAFNEKFKGIYQSGLSPFQGGIVHIPDVFSVLKLVHPGQEYLLILFSEKKIQPPFLLYLKEHLAGKNRTDIYRNVSDILGSHQIPPSEIRFDPARMQFRAITRHSGAIIPLILRIGVI